MATILSSSEHDAIHRQTAVAHGLPNQVYTCPQTAIVERDSLLAGTWTCIAFASDIKPSQALPIRLMGLPLVIVRDNAGAIRVFHNVCRHRGHLLVTAPGQLQGSIRCPYHSWTYGFDGRLRGTPHIGGTGVHDTAGIDREQRGLFAIRTAVWLGMVFINLSGDAPPFSEHIAPLENRWHPLVGDSGFELLQAATTDGPKLTLEVTANWKLAVENYCESYHLPWIHPTLNSYSRIEDHYPICAGDMGAGQGTTVFDFNSRAGTAFPLLPDWPADQRQVAEYIALFPNVLLGVHVDHFYSILLLPLSHDRTRETVEYYFVGDAAAAASYSAARNTLTAGWRDIFTEDIGVVEGMQCGRQSPAFDGGYFSSVHDSATHHFHRWVADRLRDARSLPAQDTPATLA